MLPSGGVLGRVSETSSGERRRYYLTDRLGSVRTVVEEGGTLGSARDYYPFGLRLPGRVATSRGEVEEDYTGHPRDESTQLHYAGARYYMSALARWTTVDPKAGDFPSVSPYNYSMNNPVNLIDPNGAAPLPPYTFYIRSFHPSETFGGGFGGDNRGFSTSRAVTARVHHSVTLNTDTRSLKYSPSRTFSSQSHHFAYGTATANPKGWATPAASSGNSFGFMTGYSGSNPITERAGISTPRIDVSASA